LLISVKSTELAHQVFINFVGDYNSKLTRLGL
jgi:hypothetical protein